MEVLGVILGVLLILVAILIIGAVLLQSSKNSRQSGVVSGGAEAFFGKSKGKAIDRKLNRITLILVLLFAVIVIAMYVLQTGSAGGSIDYGKPGDHLDDAFNATTTVTTTTKPVTTTAPAGTTTVTDAATTTAPVTNTPEA